MTLERPRETLGGRYVLQSLMGAGAYGEVWRATDTHRSHAVALKLLTNGDLIGARCRRLTRACTLRCLDRWCQGCPP